jgi:lathosterol oxidase
MWLGLFFSFLIVFLSLAARYFLSSGISYWFFWVRKKHIFLPKRIQHADFRREDIRREIKNSVISSLVAGFLMCATYNNDLRSYTKVYTGVGEFGLAWLVISFVLLILIHDTFFYWSHRALHHRRAFGRAHFLHHQSRNPTPFATFAFHPLEALLQFGWILPVIFLLPINLIVLNLFSMCSLVMNIIGHLGLEIYPEWMSRHWGFKYLNRSTLHNLHHQRFDSNYGLYFSFWDRCMGTLQEAQDQL